MNNDLPELAKLIRYYSLASTTAAGSGHPTSSLSATDVMVTLMFGGFFRADLDDPEYFNNDRLIFSKGHASPLFYSLYAVAGQKMGQLSSNGKSSTFLSRTHSTSPLARGEGEQWVRAMKPEEMLTLRKLGSRLEGHPTMLFPYTEVPTGSLGQGLSVGVGMALNAKMSCGAGSGSAGNKLSYRTFVLLGDSEMAEGSVWEAMACASFYKLNNLVAILDCNRLGQRGETMYGHHTEVYQKRAEAFGWDTVVIDGHNIPDVVKAFEWATSGNQKSEIRNSKQILNSKFEIPNGDKPRMVIAKTLKGKGVSFIEDKDGKHGVALKPEELEKAVAELGSIDKSLIGEVAKPDNNLSVPSGHLPSPGEKPMKFTDYPKDQKVATRKAYGNALANLVEANSRVVVLDAETSNSTYAEFVKKNHSEKFFEMFIAEQNMAGVASGFSRRGKIPFASTFAAFWSRAFDQIRMSQYAHANIKFVGSHAGVSIGEDGSSQMALEDLAMFRTLLNGVVLYPSDAVSTEKLVAEAANHRGNVYLRTTRKDTAILYSSADEFPIGGSKTLRSSKKDQVTVIGAGVTLHEALAAYEELKKDGINIRVIDLYSIKPLDIATLQKAAKETKAIITVEDHFPEGGIGEAVAAALAHVTSHKSQVTSLAVRKEPHSAKPDELLAYEQIDKNAIIKAVKQQLN